MKKIRLDVLLVERGLAASRTLAQRLVMEGLVRLDGEPALRSAANVSPDARLEVKLKPPYVSRGGEKLEAALRAFDVEVQGRVCADVGASTGGFTDCLLQHGAARVYAIDVGHGLLDWKLRQNPQVVIMEGTNARFIECLAEPVQLATIDVSFISLQIILPVVRDWLLPQGQPPNPSVIALIKPQFEAGRREVSRGKGVIRDPAIHHQVLLDLLQSAIAFEYSVRGLIRSPLTGPKGNIEFLAWLEYGQGPAINLAALVDKAMTTQEGKSTALSSGD